MITYYSSDDAPSIGYKTWLKTFILMRSCYVTVNFVKCSILQLLAHSDIRPLDHGFISGYSVLTTLLNITVHMQQ